MTFHPPFHLPSSVPLTLASHPIPQAKAKALEEQNTAYLQQHRSHAYVDVKSRVYEPKTTTSSNINTQQPPSRTQSTQPRMETRARTPARTQSGRPRPAPVQSQQDYAYADQRYGNEMQQYGNEYAYAEDYNQYNDGAYADNQNAYGRSEEPAYDSSGNTNARTNYVARNKVTTVTNANAARGKATPVNSTSTANNGRGNRELGKVPLYLQQRKAAWAREEQERQEEIEREKAKHALVLMPTEERLANLARLEEKKQMLLGALHRMRLSDDSEAGRRRKQEVDMQLKQVDAMIETMSHEKVYVKPTYRD